MGVEMEGLIGLAAGLMLYHATTWLIYPRELQSHTSSAESTLLAHTILNSTLDINKSIHVLNDKQSLQEDVLKNLSTGNNNLNETMLNILGNLSSSMSKMEEQDEQHASALHQALEQNKEYVRSMFTEVNSEIAALRKSQEEGQINKSKSSEYLESQMAKATGEFQSQNEQIDSRLRNLEEHAKRSGIALETLVLGFKTRESYVDVFNENMKNLDEIKSLLKSSSIAELLNALKALKLAGDRAEITNILLLLNPLVMILGFAIMFMILNKKRNIVPQLPVAESPFVTPEPPPEVYPLPKKERKIPESLLPNILSDTRLALVAFSEGVVAEAESIYDTLYGGEAGGSQAQPPRCHVVGDAGNLDKIPVSRGYLVVIGYNTTDTVLEGMDGFAGSRKRDAICKLQERGTNKIFIVYMDDDLSSSPPPGSSLYHPRLVDSLTNHAVLTPIVKLDQFMAIYKGQLTNFQQDHLKTWINSLCV